MTESSLTTLKKIDDASRDDGRERSRQRFRRRTFLH